MKTLKLGTSPKDIQAAAELLKKGELVAFPTETVYGLGADATNTQAIEHVFTVKGRPTDNPLIVHIAEKNDVNFLSPINQMDDLFIKKQFEVLADAFWPGPLTIILPRNENIPDTVSAGLPTVAVRMPENQTTRALIQECGFPLVGPSANISGKPSPTTADHVLQDLDGAIAAVVDGGPCTVGIESTVIDISILPLILRPGAITQTDIENILQTPVSFAATDTEDQTPRSPGVKYKHYAPTTPISILRAEDLKETEDFSTALILSPIPLHSIKSGELMILSTQTLYAGFRKADQDKRERIVIVLTDEIEKQKGLMNRIFKAAGTNRT